MARFSSRSSRNYTRKQRRVAKYGKYRQASRSMTTIGRGAGGRFVKRRVPLFHNPFSSNSELVQLKYCDTLSLNPTATDTLSTYMYSLNSLYDPDFSGTGHQPMYFDNYSQIWGKYSVRFAKIKVSIIDHNINTAVWNGAIATQPSGAYKFALIRDESVDLPSTMNNLIEQNSKNIRWRFVSPSVNGRLPKLSMKCSPSKTAGLAPDDDTLSANSTNTSPGRNVRCVVAIAPADPTSTVVPSVRCYVEITYFVKFFDRITAQPQN